MHPKLNQANVIGSSRLALPLQPFGNEVAELVIIYLVGRIVGLSQPVYLVMRRMTTRVMGYKMRG